jgi:hypothetical protein
MLKNVGTGSFRCLSNRAMAMQLYLYKEAVKKVLSDNLDMKKFLAKMVP